MHYWPPQMGKVLRSLAVCRTTGARERTEPGARERCSRSAPGAAARGGRVSSGRLADGADGATDGRRREEGRSACGNPEKVDLGISPPGKV